MELDRHLALNHLAIAFGAGDVTFFRNDGKKPFFALSINIICLVLQGVDEFGLPAAEVGH